jgi:hypothetical protein
VPATQKASRGAILTTLFRTDALPVVPAIDAPAASRKHGWLPLLSILFLISYSLMTMLIIEQGRTIESQRALIRELFRDNTALSAAKTKAAEETAKSLSSKTQAPVTQSPATHVPHAPSTQYPSTQAPASQAPSSQAVPQQQHTQSHAPQQKPALRMPSKPEADLVDDVRTLITI